MDVKILPGKLKGSVEIPSSKSVSHRALICAALAKGESVLSGISLSKDIEATINGLIAMGAEIEVNNDAIKVKGIENPPESCIIDCFESGSTLRFLIPVAVALGISAVFKGAGKLPQRPITPYLREFDGKGVKFDYAGTMPFEIKGKLSGGEYRLEGDISSQFVTGLLFALPLCSEDSVITMLSPLQSKPYADLTIDCLKKSGIKIEENEKGYFIKGGQSYSPFSEKIEGDYSQAAFFYVANALGSEIEILNLNPKSVQGDKKIIEIINDIMYTDKKGQEPFSVDVGDIPDLVPILAVLGCFGGKIFRITNASRLRIKESDRLETTASLLNSLGGKVEVFDDSLTVYPINEFSGGEVDSFNDHRIAMAASIAATRSKSPVIIRNANAVEKSYPDFFNDFNKLGGNANVIRLEP
ncbi:MAG: 3-phosphoshikimate 1-carboxyvinyltransferase [Clostridiales bacterium]|jgi:3-phosphoshikimate 1-carboxyvinyltransferase|nr:aroA [Oscillospiraceae bacterium]MDN5378268.1 3-phosphoshikimate 1-carboxyvinyltransferase [Clostridiales bacterium]